jgi:hypothetical protein
MILMGEQQHNQRETVDLWYNPLKCFQLPDNHTDQRWYSSSPRGLITQINGGTVALPAV